MKKEEVQPLIIETIQEFYTLVMEPLRRNIHQYDRQRYIKALALYEEFSGYSDVIRNMEELSASFMELGNFQISQLLSLCRDINELYGLPVNKKMPEFISDNNLFNADLEDLTPLRYVSPGEQTPNSMNEEEKNYINFDWLQNTPWNNNIQGKYIPQTPPLRENPRRVDIPLVRLRIGDNRDNSLHFLSGFEGFYETTIISRHWHRKRNRYQRYCMPPNQYIMEALRRMGQFELYGSTSTHNIEIDNALAISRTLEAAKLYLKEKLTQIQQDTMNKDYRGVPNTIFEGMQFIYKPPSGMTINELEDDIEDKELAKMIKVSDKFSDIVIEQKNIGTFDYISPYKNENLHIVYDLIPWLLWGNEMEAIDLCAEEAIMPQNVLEQVKCATTMFLTGEIEFRKAVTEIETAVRKVRFAPPSINSLKGRTQ